MQYTAARLVEFAGALLVATILLPLVSSYAQTGPARTPKVQVELLAEKTAVRPGDRITVALRQHITPGWHTYWTNPGDSGEPTRIEWKLPEGASAGSIQWPLPHAIPVGPLMNFGYSDEVLLLSDISVPESASGASFDIAADAKWLVCEEICIPEEAAVQLSLPLVSGVTPLPSPSAKDIRAARKKVPELMPWAAKFDIRGERVTIRIDDLAQQLPQKAKFHFFPLEWGLVSHAARQQASFEKGALVLGLARGDFAGEKKPASLDGVLAVETQAADGSVARHGYSFSAGPSETPIAAPAAIPPATAGSPGGLSLIVALGFAFLGGLILNLMPCVFPVLSLKALSLAKDAGNAEVRRTKGFVYLAGVLASFALIALVLVVLRGGGGAIGWGMQFQSPAFVLAMMALFLALALNLSGAFTLGGTVAGLGDSLTRRSGLSGYFFTGVLATVVATPCTAPFMGAAMGYAFTQPAPTVFAVLLALGFGFALPIVLLSLSPGLGRWLPKPGAWMETFKQLMAFPLYATVAWLLWVLTIQQGSDGVLAASVTLIGVAFAVWLFGRSPEAGQGRSAAAALIALLAIGAGIWSMPQGASDKPVVASNAQKQRGPKAEPFTQARLSELLGQNKPVFVNLTAAWCITCKVNERVALRSERIAKAFSDRDISYLVGDWTNGNPEITELLKAHGRVGVPLYLLYSGKPGEAPEILPQLLTESIVLDQLANLPSPALKQAKGDF
jgi:thiol:disulfide interchange protein/DsbC/DsbD-like thiol-disulfide interchange protein